MLWRVRFVPISEVNDSFDHLVGERQQCRGNGNAERFRGFEIDHEGKLARLLDREIAGPGASKEERHLVPSTLIRQNGCPNYIKFRMTLNGIQNRDLSWHTREAVADDEPLKPEDFPVHKSSRTTVKLPLKRALRKLQKTLRSA